MRTNLLVLMAIGLAACSSNTSSNASSSSGSSGTTPGSGQDTQCTFKLSGAVTKTLTNCNASATFDGSRSQVNFTTVGVEEAVFTLTAPADLATKAYDWPASVIQVANVTEDGGASTWEMNSSKQVGSSSITLTSLVVAGDAHGTKAYDVHGTATATLTATAGTAGPVTMDITF